jgi:hypothetical protein
MSAELTKPATTIQGADVTQMTPKQIDPEVKVETRGVTLTIVYDMDAVLYVFEKTGLNIFGGDLTGKELMHPKTLMEVIKAGLLRHHKDIEATKLVDLGNIRYWVSQIRKAMQVVSPDEIIQLESELKDGVESGPLPSSASGSTS